MTSRLKTVTGVTCDLQKLIIELATYRMSGKI